MKEELRRLVGSNEMILYEGKPDKKCFIFESIFNPLLPFALLWAIIDFSVLGGAFLSGGKDLFFLIPFFAIHLMPVWIYLGGVLFSVRKYNNTAYIITDRAIYVSSGIINRHINTKPFAELSHIDLHRGFFDQRFGVGDIIATSSHYNSNGNAAVITINSISNYVDIYNLVKKLQTDIYTDIMYPNAKRPDENPGYNTQYRGL